MSKVLVFGGDNLPAGTHTWYMSTKGKGEVRAEVGHEVALEDVENAQYFLDTKRASVKKSTAAPSA